MRALNVNGAIYVLMRRLGRHAAGEARHLRLLGNLAISQRAHHLQHFAPGRERPAVFALVLVHRLHELDLVVGVIALAGRRIDLATAFPLFIAPFLAAAAFQGDRNLPFAAIVGAPLLYLAVQPS